MPQGSWSPSFPPWAGLWSRGDGDWEQPRQDGGGHVQAAPVSVPQLRHHHRPDESWLPALLRPDGGHQHWRAPGLHHPREMGAQVSPGWNHQRWYRQEDAEQRKEEVRVRGRWWPHQRKFFLVINQILSSSEEIQDCFLLDYLSFHSSLSQPVCFGNWWIIDLSFVSLASQEQPFWLML